MLDSTFHADLNPGLYHSTQRAPLSLCLYHRLGSFPAALLQPVDYTSQMSFFRRRGLRWSADASTAQTNALPPPRAWGPLGPTHGSLPDIQTCPQQLVMMGLAHPNRPLTSPRGALGVSAPLKVPDPGKADFQVKSAFWSVLRAPQFW